MFNLSNNLAAITTILLAAGMIAFAFPAQTFSATNSFNVNLNVEAGNQDRGDDSPKSKGQSANLIIRINDIERGQDFIAIDWETTADSQTTVRWSRSDGGGETVQTSQSNAREHTTRLDNLQAGTRYEIELEAEAVTGETKTRKEVVRTRLPAAPDSPDEFAANLTAENNVLLSWGLPETENDYIRVVRSEDFFPQGPMEGELIYEGRNERTQDANVQTGQTYFYSAFVRDNNGQWSAPSLTAIYVPAGDDAVQTQPGIDEVVDERPEAPEATKDLLSDLSFTDMIFSQADHAVATQDKVASLAANQRFSVGLDYDTLPEVLKTVVVTVSRPGTDESFSFLLRRPEKEDFYSATVGALQESGLFDVEVTVLDYKYRRVKTVTGQIKAEPAESSRQATSSPVIGQFADLGPTSSDAGGFILLLLLILIAGGMIIGLERWLADPRRAHR